MGRSNTVLKKKRISRLMPYLNLSKLKEDSTLMCIACWLIPSQIGSSTCNKGKRWKVWSDSETPRKTWRKKKAELSTQSEDSLTSASRLTKDYSCLIMLTKAVIINQIVKKTMMNRYNTINLRMNFTNSNSCTQLNSNTWLKLYQMMSSKKKIWNLRKQNQFRMK